MRQCTLTIDDNVLTVTDNETQKVVIRLTNVELPFVYDAVRKAVKQNVEVPLHLATAEEAGRVLGIQPATLRQLSARGEIDGCIIFNGRKYWEKAAIYDLARKLEKGNAPT